jgi:putative FmdB family regulatory protein
MPLYEITCQHCGHHDEIYRSVAEYDDLPECCGESMRRVICAPLVYGDIEPYISQIDGSIIHSRSRHREHLKSHGCIEIGNEKVTPKPLTPPSGLKETLIRVANEKLRYGEKS